MTTLALQGTAREERVFRKKGKAHQKYVSESGEIFPGVTTILGVINKPQLVPWANKLGLQGIDSTRYVDATATVGTLAHEMVQEYLGGPSWDRGRYAPEEVDLAENALLKFFEWEKHITGKVETIAIEKPLLHEPRRYGGTIDWIGRIEGKTWLIDFKTSRALYPEHVYQIAAYNQLCWINDIEIQGVRIIKIGRNCSEGFEDKIISSEELQYGEYVFICALQLYRAIDAYEKNR